MSADELLRIHIPKFEMYETPKIKRQPMNIVSRAVQIARQQIMAQEDANIFAAIDALSKRKYNICG